MKIIILILSLLLLACTAPKIEMPTGILSEKVCASILKEIHLEEAAFELNKSKGVINAKNSLATSYQSIYKKHNIDDSTFSKSLEYYAKHPEILEEIYSAVLGQLTDERSTLDHQGTN